MPLSVSLLAVAVATLAPFVRADAAASLASQYSLTSTTTFPFPTQTMNSSAATPLITQGWALARDSIQQGGPDLAFVPDPFPSSSSSNSSAPVLQVTYPAGSYSHQTGGAQFVNTWNGAALGSVVVTYEVAFPAGFDFVKGGKLPGVRGGPQVEGCSGGRQPSGTDCFSTRLMWRTGGAGEIYAYTVEPQSEMCQLSNVTCSDGDWGYSIQRGRYTFESGTWNKVTMLVQLNDPPSASNGFIELYFNDVQAISQSGLQIRNSSTVTIGGLYFSTFFGGNDTTWSTPNETHTFFRNIALYGATGASTMKSSALPGHTLAGAGAAVVALVATMFLL